MEAPHVAPDDGRPTTDDRRSAQAGRTAPPSTVSHEPSGPVALCLADTHSSQTALRRLDARLAQLRGRVQLVLAAGDITIAGHEDYAQQFIDCVRSHGLPLLLVHGNNDSRTVVELFRREGVSVHRHEREALGHRFVGIGGDGHAPHDVELGDGESEEMDLEGAIFITHVPPPGRLALSTRDGPDVPRTFEFGGQLLEGGPRAHLCGHIHHTEGVGYYAGTKIVKLRAAMWNSAALLDLDTLKAEFIALDPDAPRTERGRATHASPLREYGANGAPGRYP